MLTPAGRGMPEAHRVRLRKMGYDVIPAKPLLPEDLDGLVMRGEPVKVDRNSAALAPAPLHG